MMDAFLYKPIGKAMSNPVSLAVMITLIVMLIIVFTYDSEHKLRTGIRIFGVALLFMFINNHIILRDMHDAQLNAEQRGIVDAVSGGALTPNESLVVPAKDIISDDNLSSA
jgi:hypothetical protein